MSREPDGCRDALAILMTRAIWRHDSWEGTVVEARHLAVELLDAAAVLLAAPRQEGERRPPLPEPGTFGACYDCGRHYGDEFGFPDLVLPHDVWAKISPSGDEGGLLCPSCICRRAHALGMSGVPAMWASGPLVAVPYTRANPTGQDRARSTE
jgi:hypothetical protein